MGQNAIVTNDLHRHYGTGEDAFEAVRGVDLTVETGTIHALLGINGAGKTSTLETIEGLASPSSGSVSVLDLDPVADRAVLRPRTGVLLQHSGFIADLTVRETLQMWAATVTSARPVTESLTMLDLEALADTRMRALSGGEQRRVDLALTLMGRPEVVMLDEPTTGLDPESRRRVRRLIEELRGDGVTVLLTTHYLEEAETLSDRISIMAAGRIVREGTVASLVADHPSTISFRTPAATLPPLRNASVTSEGDTTRIEVSDVQSGLTHLLRWADDEHVRLDDLRARSASLESVFLEIAEGGREHERTDDSASPADVRHPEPMGTHR
jgi:ABC-2 type transport system ATP-binding protein